MYPYGNLISTFVPSEELNFRFFVSHVHSLDTWHHLRAFAYLTLRHGKTLSQSPQTLVNGEHVWELTSWAENSPSRPLIEQV